VGACWTSAAARACATEVRYRGLMKNTQQLHTLLALSDLWMMRRAAFEPDAAPLAPHRLYVDGSVRQIEF